jgi:cytoskeletal protein CcmA (bactofilin family)
MFKRYKNPFDGIDVETPMNYSPNTVATSGNPLARPAVTPTSVPEPHRFFDDKATNAMAGFLPPSGTEKATFVPPTVGKRPFAQPAMAPLEEPDTTLGEGVVFKGQLSFKRLLRIDGQFEGELISEGKLVVGPTGVVKSNVKMREAIIEGVVEGNICVQEKLELRANARIIGDIEARFLIVDEGVTLLGHVCVKAD